MIKSKFGPITNPKTGMSKDIVINALSKESLKDILIGALCELSDFHIEERIVIKDKRTGRIWR